MRTKGLWVVALLAVAGAVAWALTRPTQGPPSEGRAGPGDGAVARGADLSPTGEHRGRSSIVGTVRRRGAPIAARVELRFSSAVDSQQALRQGPGAFFARVVAPPIGLERPAAVTTSGEDGRFTVPGLEAGGWHVRAVSADGSVGAAVVTLAVDGARAAVDLEVGAGREVLEGRIVYADGRAFRGLVTVDRSSGGSQRPAALVATGEILDLDGEGRFRAAGLEPGAYVVSAIEVGAFRAVGKPVVVPTTSPYVMTVGAGGGVLRLEGRVVAEADGSPIAGAEVLAGGVQATTSSSWPRGRRRTGTAPSPITAGGAADGGVVVRATGYAMAMASPSLAPSGPLEIRLARAGSVGGRVTSEGDGAPVGGLTVSATAPGRGLAFGGTPAVTDADGRYRIDDVTPGEALVTAVGGGWFTKGAGDATRGYGPRIALVEPGNVAAADLVVARGARLAGVVFGPDGAPTPGAVVRALARASDPMGAPPASASTVVASGADGVFLLEGLAPDTPYDVVASAPGAAEARVGPTVATTAQPPPRVEVRLAPLRTVDVTVVDADTDAPVVGATVRASVPSAVAPSSRPGVVTDVEGRARIEIAPGVDVTVVATHDDYLRAEGTKVVDGAPRVALRLRRALAISGTVVQPDGTPAVAARVTSETRGRWVRPTQTDAQGRFRLTSLEPGTYDLEARLLKAERVGLVATAAVEAGTADVVLKLARPEGQATGLVVRVLGPDGKPVPRAYAQLDFPDGASNGSSVEGGVAIVDLSGRAAGFAGATVRVERARGSSDTPLPFGPGRVGPLTGNETEVEVRLPIEATVTGVVRDPDGAPVAGAVVLAASPAQANDLEWAFESDGVVVPRARTDADGRFRIGGLGDGAEVELHVAPPPAFPPPGARPGARGQKDVVVTLAPGTAVVVTVLDEAGAPVRGATVHTTLVEERRADGPWPSPRSGPAGRADATGAVRLRGFDLRKRYALAVDGPAEDWITSRRDAWSPKDETIRLTRALKVAGVVRDPAGQPLAGVQIYRRLGEGSWGGGPTTDAAGRFQLDGLPAGEVVLRAAVGPMGGDPPPLRRGRGPHVRRRHGRRDHARSRARARVAARRSRRRRAARRRAARPPRARRGAAVPGRDARPLRRRRRRPRAGPRVGRPVRRVGGPGRAAAFVPRARRARRDRGRRGPQRRPRDPRTPDRSAGRDELHGVGGARRPRPLGGGHASRRRLVRDPRPARGDHVAGRRRVPGGRPLDDDARPGGRRGRHHERST